MQFAAPDDVAVKLEGGAVQVDPHDETKRARAMWGTSRTLVANLVAGVTKGFEEKLEIIGVGYRAAVQGKNLQLALGYSHDVVYPIPAGHHDRDAEADRDHDHRHRQADRSARSPPRSASSGRPEPYKGKGVKYAGEFIFRKEGKKK